MRALEPREIVQISPSEGGQLAGAIAQVVRVDGQQCHVMLVNDPNRRVFIYGRVRLKSIGFLPTWSTRSVSTPPAEGVRGRVASRGVRNAYRGG